MLGLGQRRKCEDVAAEAEARSVVSLSVWVRELKRIAHINIKPKLDGSGLSGATDMDARTRLRYDLR